MKYKLLKPLWGYKKGDDIEISDDKLDFAERKGFIKIDNMVVENKMIEPRNINKKIKTKKARVGKVPQTFIGHKNIN